MIESKASNDDFNPENLTRHMALDGGTGRAVVDKHAQPTLRVFRGHEAEWFPYGGFIAGCQGKGWIEMPFKGILRWEGEYTFGQWILRIEGTGDLEPLARDLAKHTRTRLSAGKEDKYEVTAIKIIPMPAIVMQAGVEVD